MYTTENDKRLVAEADAQIKALHGKINTVSLMRLVVILGGAALIFQCVRTEIVWLTLFSIVAVMLLFMWLVARQSRLEGLKRAAEDLRWIGQNELDIQAGRPNGYTDGAAFADNRHPYTADLDVFGESSVFSLVNRCATPGGVQQLAFWLQAPATAAVIRQRQEAVRELHEMPEWAQHVQAHLLFNHRDGVDYRQRFHHYLSNSLGAFGSRGLRWYVMAAPWVFFGTIGLSFFVDAFSGIAMLVAVVHLLMAIAASGKVSRISSGIDKTSRVLTAFAGVFRQIENYAWQSPLNKGLADELVLAGQQPVSGAISGLAVLINKLDYRLNILVGAFLNIVFLWDFKQVFGLLTWRQKYGDQIVKTFDALSQMEALLSLSVLHRNHPQWVFPEIVAGNPERIVFEAGEMKHPLIPDAVSVANDYAMENHRIALITGSNMAGKSTFLRTVGSNLVLAFAGAPVCAGQMRASVVHLVTYMRIRDSLNESTSTFKAELNRMQLILQTVERERNTFFLLDEMLRGTNSVDKYLGSKAVIRKLIADNGTGMVATHDLQLAKLAEEYPEVVRNFHFDIQVANDEMLFDYKLKHGECTIFNASMLLRQIGVHIE